ncbi:MAG: ureidoglycolate lyase [Alphaproteobacteria bacterium]|nr:ureidoglycolate lyase [Alphaproteobacteria bacterium]
MKVLRPEPLTKAGFAPYGDVVSMEGAGHFTINQGYAERFNDLCRVDVAEQSGEINISIVEAMPRPRPIAIWLMERHPLGTQIFHPMQDRPWLVVVCSDVRTPDSYRAFLADGRQGVNYARNIWHHPLLVLDAHSLFLVVDRKGPGNNLEEVELDEGLSISLDLPALHGG